KSYVDGALLDDKFLVYQGRNGRLSSWLDRVYRRGTSGSEDFVGQLSYDSLGLPEGVRAPQRLSEVARDYRRFFDRGTVVRLGELPDPSEYLATVEYNPGGGVYRVVFPTGAFETIDYDESYRPSRIQVTALQPPVPGDDFNNNRGGQPLREVVW